MNFFQTFNFDTLLALISCLASIIALFVGGKAYKNCKINKNNNTHNKKIDDNSVDNSINVGGDYYSSGVSDSTLLSVVDRISNMTSSTFTAAMDNAYNVFQQKCDANLHSIIEEASQIVKKQKLSIAGYTKIDWINIYFESAKNTSDAFMQQVWAKVLAQELSQPNSFCYKTIDVLKNMSECEFRMLESLATVNIYGAIARGDYLDDCGLSWINLQRLREYGLISLDSSEKTISIDSSKESTQIINGQFLLLYKNISNKKITARLDCYLLTNAAIELLNIVSTVTSDALAIQIGLKIKEACPKDCIVTLHRINYIYDIGRKASYQREDLLVNVDSDGGQGNNT